jgi:hypothetical protein
MARYTFNGDAAEYFPTSGIFAHRGDTYEWGDIVPPANRGWVPEGGSVSRETQVAAPVAAAPSPAEAAAVSAADQVKAAEAYLEANPALAAKILNEVKNA